MRPDVLSVLQILIFLVGVARIDYSDCARQMWLIGHARHRQMA